ncbi:MAG: DUF503 domain-containing protein [Anaerolineae bacterium]|jgi:uncharacterized protein YlxP (DUF503 family)|nr:DUF503 domain-containing protein [Anaerolineae bacterium]
MIIGACTIELLLPGVTSLKEKRGVLRPLLHQLRQRFEVAAAEVAHQDAWQTSNIALVAVANEASHIYTVLEHAVHWIEDAYCAVQVITWEIELR